MCVALLFLLKSKEIIN